MVRALTGVKSLKNGILLMCIVFSTLFALVPPIYNEIIENLKKVRVQIIENNNNNRYNESIGNLSLFLLSYNGSELIKIIRNIESNIYFEEISNNDKNLNNDYNTGISPHFYDGQYSFSKTCKHLKFSYRCPPSIVINKTLLNQWTLRINENNLSPKSKIFLYKLQKNYNFYNNLHDKFISNLQIFESPFHGQLNLLFYGNSYLRQMVEGMNCIIDEITDHVIIDKYMPIIRPLNASKPILFNYNDTFCETFNYGHINKWNHREWNGLHLNSSIISNIFNQMKMKNIYRCFDDELFIEYMDKSTIYYHFAHYQSNKQLNKLGKIRKIFGKNNLNKNILYNWDIIIFNVGNHPQYDYTKKLKQDLINLNHLNKPIVFLSTFNNDSLNEYKLFNNKTYLNDLYDEFPNLIWINLYDRLHRKFWCNHFVPMGNHFKMLYLLSEYDRQTLRGHLCQPGAVEHFILSLVELINLLSFIPTI